LLSVPCGSSGLGRRIPAFAIYISPIYRYWVYFFRRIAFSYYDPRRPERRRQA